jgi:hypothetical protein
MARDPKGKDGGARKKQINRELVLRALTDRKFRKQLEEAPRAVLRKEVSGIHQREIALVLAAVRGIEAQIRLVGDELLCLNGPCGIA